MDLDAAAFKNTLTEFQRDEFFGGKRSGGNGFT